MPIPIRPLSATKREEVASEILDELPRWINPFVSPDLKFDTYKLVAVAEVKVARMLVSWVIEVAPKVDDPIVVEAIIPVPPQVS